VAPDVIVVGAGAIGASIAYQLAKIGLMVTILERGPVGGGASGAAAGIIAAEHDPDLPESFAQLGVESARLFPALAEELRERSAIDIGLRRTPLITVAFDDAEARALRSRRAREATHGTMLAWVDPGSALDVEPALNPAVVGGIVSSDAHQVMPRALSRALATAAVNLGTTLRQGSNVDRLLVDGDRVVGIGLGTETVRASQVVIAGGAWTAAWSSPLQRPIPVYPVRGQMVALRTAGTPLRSIVMSSGGYVLTKADGSTLVGTTLEDVGFDARPTAEGVGHLLSLAGRLAPRLADAAVDRVWAGLRPATPDGLPLIGRLPGWQGITLATGHFRHGILLAPITGELVADLVAERRPRLSLQAFDPGRFLVRAA
jgi:glycine oxidase